MSFIQDLSSYNEDIDYHHCLQRFLIGRLWTIPKYIYISYYYYKDDIVIIVRSLLFIIYLFLLYVIPICFMKTRHRAVKTSVYTLTYKTGKLTSQNTYYTQ